MRSRNERAIIGNIDDERKEVIHEDPRVRGWLSDRNRL
jgi:hypothetical protein